jgi:hypothetical protein
MKEALSVIRAEFVSPDRNGELQTAHFLQESNPSPKVDINSMSAGDVSFDTTTQVATFTLTGRVSDEIAQVTGDGSADIQKVSLYGEGKLIAEVPLTKTMDAPTLLKPYAHHYDFSKSVTIDMKNSMFYSVEAVTSDNKLQRSGRSSVLLSQNITKVETDTPTGSTVTYAISAPQGFSETSADVISYSEPGVPTPITLTETSLTSMKFVDSTESLTIDLIDQTSLNPASVDLLTAKISDISSSLTVSHFGRFTETGVDTKSFAMILTVNSTTPDEKYTASFSDVHVLSERSKDADFAPYLFRLKGKDVDKLRISIDGKQYSLTEMDGFYYLSGSPIKVFIIGKGNVVLLDGTVKDRDIVQVFTVEGWPTARFAKPSTNGTGIAVSRVDFMTIEPDRAYGGTEQEITMSITNRKWQAGDKFEILGQTKKGESTIADNGNLLKGTFEFATPPVDSRTKASISVITAGVPSTLHEVFYLNNPADRAIWVGSVPDSILPFLIRREFRIGDVLNWKTNNFTGQQALWGHALTWDELAFLDQTKQRSDIPPWTLVTDLDDKERALADKIFSDQTGQDDRYESYANFKSRNRIIFYAGVLTSQNQVLDIYRICRDGNPLNFAWERGWQIGGGEEQFTRIKVSKIWAGAEMMLALAIFKATDVGVAKLQSSIATEAISFVPRREVLSIKIDPAAAYPKTAFSMEMTPSNLASIPRGRLLWARTTDGKFFVSQRYTSDFPNLGNGQGGISHPQILGGQVPVTGAGEIVVQNGKIVVITNQSGHFKPTTLQAMDCVTDMWKQGFKFECKPGTVGIVGYKIWNGKVIK